MAALDRMLCPSPIGPLTLYGTAEALTALDFGDTREEGRDLPSPLLERACLELEEYFRGTRRRFSVPLAPAGTAFQRRIWDALLEIPYGETASYGEIAARIGAPRSCRAVGGANHRNPLPIFIPCHRVVGGGGQLTGYAGGLEIKRALLTLEAAGGREEPS